MKQKLFVAFWLCAIFLTTLKLVINIEDMYKMMLRVGVFLLFVTKPIVLVNHVNSVNMHIPLFQLPDKGVSELSEQARKQSRGVYS